MRDDFAVFILAHGRPDKLITVNALKRCGYTGKYYIILDDEDKTIPQYKHLFGEDKILIFSKSEVLKTFDIMDNFPDKKVVVFARNVCFDFARQLGLTYFAEFEDDYKDFAYRYPDGKSLRRLSVKDFDKVVDIFIDFLEASKARTVAFAQAGEMMGGTQGAVWRARVKRKAMNTFFFKVGTPAEDIKFIGRFNDDVNTYVSLGSRGELFLQCANVNLEQMLTQEQTGGNTDAYLKYGTYSKSFYSVMVNPSCVKVSMMGTSHRRIHHKVQWEYAVPKILSAKYRKDN